MNYKKTKITEYQLYDYLIGFVDDDSISHGVVNVYNKCVDGSFALTMATHYARAQKNLGKREFYISIYKWNELDYYRLYKNIYVNNNGSAFIIDRESGKIENIDL